MAKYTPDDKYFKIPNNGLFIGINNAEVGKSYTFSIKPRFDIEKEVKLIIFLIPDLQAAVDNNLISIEFATGLSLAGLIPDPNNTNNYIPAPIQGQATAYAEIINLPTVNPKNNTNLSSSSDLDLNQRIITFNTSGIKQMQIIYPGETKYRTSSGKSVNSIDEYIDEVLITAENVYKINMYQISISTEADFAKFDLPENKVEFTQEQPKPEENTEDKKDNEPVTNTEKPVSKTGITFDVTKEGTFTNTEFGELKIVNPSLDGFDFGDDFEDLNLLDDEFQESSFEGMEETINEIIDEPMWETPAEEPNYIPTPISGDLTNLLYESNGKYYVKDSWNGLAGPRLKKILTELQEHLRKNGYPGTVLKNNGVMRDLKASTYPNNPKRAVASLHGAGLAIDVIFNIPGKVWEGIGDNKNLASDTKLNKVIYNWVKSQGDLTWGGQWGGSKPAEGNVKGWGITEYHHFEIKASYISKYWEPYKDSLAQIGFSYDNLYKVGRGSNLEKLNKSLLASVNITA